MQHVFIIGAKGIPGHYGGYETFVDKLTEYHERRTDLKYHVACKGTKAGEYEYHNARCFRIRVPDIGSVQAIYYDVAALKSCCEYIKKHRIRHPVVYVLACRIGPFIRHYEKKIHKLGGELYVNPDGHEWLRAKWPFWVRKYWKLSERMMVKHADLLVCDSRNIEKYIRKSYEKYHPNTTYIAYGAETGRSPLPQDHSRLESWYRENQLSPGNYYLVVGRFVPENNFETMIREFMKSGSERDLAIITTGNEAFFKRLEKRLHFSRDKRIKFVGTVYDQDLLKKIRENAYGYIHGHEVGGTNPSLLEALGSTKLNLLLNVSFNREVGGRAAVYWSKKPGSLAALLNEADRMPPEQIEQMGRMARSRIQRKYSWELIASSYAKLFLQRRNMA